MKSAARYRVWMRIPGLGRSKKSRVISRCDSFFYLFFFISRFVVIFSSSSNTPTTAREDRAVSGFKIMSVEIMNKMHVQLRKECGG